MALTAPTTTRGTSALRVLESGARVVAVVAFLGLLAFPAASLVAVGLALVVAEVVGRDWPRTPYVSVACAVAGAVFWLTVVRWPPEVAWLPLALGAVLLSRLASERLRLVRELPPGAPESGRTRGIAGPAIALVVAVLLATLIGSRVEMPLGDPQQHETTGSVGEQARASDVDGAVQPYVGLSDSLDTSGRGDLGDEVVLTVRASAPVLLLVLVTAIWGVTFVQVQDALALYPLFAFLAVRFAISVLVLAPFAWAPVRELPREGVAAGLGVGVLLAAAYGLQTAGLDLTTVASTGFITGLYVVFTPLIAFWLFGTRVPTVAWIGVSFAVVGLLLLNGVPGGSPHQLRRNPPACSQAPASGPPG